MEAEKSSVKEEAILLWSGKKLVKLDPDSLEETVLSESSESRSYARIVYSKGMSPLIDVKVFGLF